jgi:hypothetical protein
MSEIPAYQALQGDDQIRTGVVGLGTDSVYEARGGSNLAAAYAIATGLMVAAALGWPYVLVFSLIVGPALGAQHALSPTKGTGSSAC